MANANNQDFSGKRIHRTKSLSIHRRTSVDSLKTGFRTKFFDRLRTTRSRSVDRFRHIIENYEEQMEIKSLKELQDILLKDQEATELLNSEEVSSLLNDVENEMKAFSLQCEADKYALEEQNELEDAEQRLNHCQVCQELSLESICPKCALELKSEFDKTN